MKPAPLLNCGRTDDHDPHRWHGPRPLRRPYWCVGAPDDHDPRYCKESAA